MDYLRKAQAKLKEVVLDATSAGGSTDEEFDAYRSRMDALGGLVGTLKVSFEDYATEMGKMTQASVEMANRVSRFYRKSANRQASVNLFCDSQFNMDAHCVEMFKDLFGWEVLKKFDDWEDEISMTRDDVATAEQAHMQVAQYFQKLEGLKHAMEKRKGDKEIAAYEAAKEKLQKATAHMTELRQKLDEKVSKMVEERFSRFDGIFVQIMECQMKFFSQAAEITGQFKTNVSNYRARYPAGSNREPRKKPEKKTANGNGMHVDTASGSKGAKPPVKIHNRGQDGERQNPIQASAASNAKPTKSLMKAPPTSPRRERNATKPAPPKTVDILSGFNDATSQPSSPQDAQPDFLNMFGIAPAPAGQSSPPAAKPELDLFGGGGGGGDDFFASAASTEASSPPSGRRRSSDDLSLMFGSGRRRSSDGLGSMFGISGSSNSSGLTRQDSVSRELDEADAYDAASAYAAPDLDDYVAPAETPAKPKPTDADFDIFAGDNAAPASGNSDRVGAYRKMVADQDAHKQAKLEARDNVQAKLDAWEFNSSGSRNNIRTLLSNLESILWESHKKKWKKLTIADLLDNKKVKMGYRKSQLLTHPDRLKGDITVEQKVVAERAFEAINEAWGIFAEENDI